jgi:HD-GYP domain-containing protein (c-di-GMP phosphodiesterase class II)
MSEEIEDLDKMVEDLTMELAQSFYQTVQVLSTIVSTQNIYYDGNHSRFVSQKSAQVAQVLGMNDTEIYEIKVAGLLHDIGKVGYRDTILSKFVGEMKGNEYQQYILHPQFGKQFLKMHNGFDNIGDIILQHHEKLDGSGFPLHLQGKEINPQSAIICIVDTFHNAVYKKQRETQNQTKYTSAVAFLDASRNRFNSSLNYLQAKAGILFDRTVVKVFTDIIEAERRGVGEKTVMRLPVSKLRPGMLFAEDIVTNYGLVLCYAGESVTDDILQSLLNTSRWHEIPPKILVMK